MDNKKIAQVISIIIFMVGLICLGGLLCGIFWDPMAGWNGIYTWLLVIGLPCFIVGVVLVNRTIKD
jgi:hypothetical protein